MKTVKNIQNEVQKRVKDGHHSMEREEKAKIVHCEKDDYLKIKEAKNREIGEMIKEYERQNNIKVISEEELLDLIPESALYPIFYLPYNGRYSDSGTQITEYELYLIRNGINVFENEGNEYLDELQKTEDGIDLDDADTISEGEWECELQYEFESLPNGMRTKTLDVFVTDSYEAIKWYRGGLDDTTLHLRIHCDCGDGKFLIVVTQFEQLYYYRVYLEFMFDENGRRICLGTSYNVNNVIKIIMFYKNSGNCYGDC
jgi:hypothetical protein